jgi:hypothetical protein
LVSWEISDTESYDLQRGYDYHGDNPVLTQLSRYGFTQDALIPGLGQYQTLSNVGSGDLTGFRKGVGKTMQMSALLYGLDKGVRFLDTTGQGYITATQRRMMALNPRMAFPVSPFGKMLRISGGLSLLMIYYDLIDYGMNVDFLGSATGRGQSFLDGLVEFFTMGMFQ